MGQYAVEYLTSSKSGSAPPEPKLALKIGLPLILLQILKLLGGDVHGASYVFKASNCNVLILETVTWGSKCKTLALNKMPCGPGGSNFPIKESMRAQFHLNVCLAITVKKRKDSCLVVQDLSDTVFAHGHLFVRLSGVTPTNKRKIHLPSDPVSRSKHEICAKAPV